MGPPVAKERIDMLVSFMEDIEHDLSQEQLATLSERLAGWSGSDIKVCTTSAVSLSIKRYWIFVPHGQQQVVLMLLTEGSRRCCCSCMCGELKYSDCDFPLLVLILINLTRKAAAEEHLDTAVSLSRS